MAPPLAGSRRITSGGITARLVIEGGRGMIAWILGFLAGPLLLAGLAVYLCRGPRWHRRLTSGQIAQLQALADVEMHEDLLLRGAGAGLLPRSPE
jgi:hypothetical protein